MIFETYDGATHLQEPADEVVGQLVPRLFLLGRKVLENVGVLLPEVESFLYAASACGSSRPTLHSPLPQV